MPNTQAPRDGRSLLRRWRELRKLSQLEVSLRSGVSQRHLSFLESGRSRPSREVLGRLADVLDIPYRQRNDLLLEAGFAPAYAAREFDAAELRMVTQALRQVLSRHEPYPALVLDPQWQVVMVNEAAPRVFGSFVDLTAWPKPRNLLDLVFSPKGLQPSIGNWDELAPALLRRVAREALGGVADAAPTALVERLLAYPGSRPEWRHGAVLDGGNDLPMIPLCLRRDDVMLSYFSMLTTLATPRSIATQELRIECLYPADVQTEAAHARLFTS